MPQIRLKKINDNARLPEQANGDVGFDVFSAGDYYIPPRGRMLIGTGWQLAAEPMIDGACLHGNLRSLLKVEGRSGLALREGVWPIGGIVDPSYRGEIGVIMFNSTDDVYYVPTGMKVAQLVWYPVVANWSEYGRNVRFWESSVVEETERGDDGYGSTGK